MVKRILYSGLLIIFLFSCTKQTGVAGPSGPAGNNGQDGILLDTGTLKGDLAIYDEFGKSVPDYSGATVTLHVDNKDRSVMTDASGNYIFRGLPAGTYNLSYEKSGYGTMKVFGISHFAPGNIPTSVPRVYLLENPVKTAIDSISFTDLGTIISLNIYLDTSSDSYHQFRGNFMLLVGKDADLNTSNGVLSIWNDFIEPHTGGYYQVYLDKSTFTGLSAIPPPYYITVGTFNRYVQVTGSPYLLDTHNFSDYLNPEDGKYVYPSLKMAPNILFIQ